MNTFRPYPYVNQFDFLFLCFQCIWGLLLIYVIVRQVVMTFNLDCLEVGNIICANLGTIFKVFLIISTSTKICIAIYLQHIILDDIFVTSFSHYYISKECNVCLGILHENFIIMAVLICYSLFQILDLKNQGVSGYFSDPWHSIELLNNLFSLLAVVFLTLRTLEVIDKVEFLKNNRGKVVLQLPVF